MLVAHKIFGVPQTINAAYYVSFLAYKELAAFQDPAFNAPNRDLEPILSG
jgi:geranylgeranyl diphosphate synthase type 3